MRSRRNTLGKERMGVYGSKVKVYRVGRRLRKGRRSLLNVGEGRSVGIQTVQCVGGGRRRV